MSKKHVFEPKNAVIVDRENFKVKGRKKATLLYKVYMNLLARGYDVKWIDMSEKDVGMDGISIFPDSCESDFVAPIFSNDMIESIFQPGMNITQLADQVRKLSENVIGYLYIDSMLRDRAYVFSNVEVVVCKASCNKDLLSGVLYKEIEGTDLAAYVRIRLDEPFCHDFFEKYLSEYDYNPEEIFQAAQENSWKERHISIEEIKEEHEVYIVRNFDSSNALALLLSNQLLKQLYEVAGNRDIYVFPFTSYSFAFSPKDDWTPKEAIDYMKTVTAGIILKETIVTDQVYCYDGLKLSTVCEE